MSNEVVLIDLSSIAHPIWHMSASEPDPNHCSQAVVARVHALASGHEHVAVCCDSGRSFRHDVDSTYKANRPERDEAFAHQVRLAVETLERDGFPVWTAKGFEADDVIAAAAMRAVAQPDTEVLIVSADKDLLQLVGPQVKAKSVRDGSILDADAVFAKFGVKPEQMRDYLMIVGDSSDNVKGVNGLGPKKAAALLATFGSLDAVYAQLDNGRDGLSPAICKALEEFRPRLETTRQLISLRADVEIPFDSLFQPRISQAAAEFTEDTMQTEEQTAPGAEEQTTTQAPAGEMVAQPPTAMVVREAAPAPAEWERHLEPRSMDEAKQLAKFVFESRLFSAYGTPQAALMTILAGRELGLPAMGSLRAFHIIEGKPTLSADFIRSLVLKSGLARFFRCTERSATKATFETQRGDDPPISLTFTIEEARLAWSKDETAWNKSAWGHNPADMLVARASAKLARLVYPDLAFGLYAPEEIEAA